MPDPGAELSREVGRIVASPYPPSLAKLAGLCESVDSLIVRACLYDLAPCDLNKLASIVIAALPLWQYSVVVLHGFSHSPEFVSSLLLLSPGLLDALLTKASSSDEAFVQYAQLCVTLLSRPLPETVPLPASAQPFFLDAFERATQRPQVETLDPVYRMLNGACRGLLSALPPETRQAFDAKLRHLLSSNNAAQDSMLMLWCFGITILAEHPEITKPSPALTWETAAGRKLFGSDVHKTIGLAYLNVVWAAKGGVGVSDSEALEGIRIASQSLRYIEKRDLERWPASGDFAKSMFQKLPSKILRKDINPAVQLEALAFYAMIAGKSLPRGLVRAYEAALSNVLSLVDAEFLKENLSMSLPLFAAHMDESSVRMLVSMIFKASITPTSAREMANVHIIINELASILIHDCRMRSAVLAIISSDDMHETVQQFFRVDVEMQGAVTVQPCKSFTGRTLRRLVSATVSLCLTAALSHDTSAALPKLLSIGLVRKQQQLPHLPDECGHHHSTNNIPSVSLLQQECTPLSSVPLQDWRGRLTAELEAQGFYQRDSVIRSVAQICHDLETRCQAVEEPLRQEREKSTHLENDIRDLRGKLSLIELKRWEDGEHISALDAEIQRLEKERDQSADQLARLKRNLEDAIVEAERTRGQLQNQHSVEEARLRSTILTHEEGLKEREREIKELHTTLVRKNDENSKFHSTVEAIRNDVVGYKSEIADLLRAKDTLSEEVHGAREASRSLQHQINSLEIQLTESRCAFENQQAEAHELSTEVDRLQSECSSLKNSLQDTESELAASTCRLEDLQNRHQDLAKSSTEALKRLEKQFESEMDATESRAAAEQQRLDKDLQAALQRGQDRTEAYEKLQREFQELQASIHPLNAQLQELNNAYNDQGEELEALLNWKNQLMISMSLPPDRSRRRTGPRLTEALINPNPPTGRRRETSLRGQELSQKATVSAQHVNSTVIENVANAPFTSSSGRSSRSGSTPKRVKPRPLYTPRSTKSKSVLVSKLATTRLLQGKRQALRSISPNRRHTTVGFNVEEGEEPGQSQDLPLRKRRASLQNDEQADLSMDEFMAGTPWTPGAFSTGTGRFPDEEGTTEL